MKLRPVISVYGEPLLPWDYFVLQAARGSVKVPTWVLLALPEAVSWQVGVAPEDVTEAHVEEALMCLPEDPTGVLTLLFDLFEADLPGPGSFLKLDDQAPLGSFREAVAQLDLLHDAAIILQTQYDAAGFMACMESIEGDDWDARGAVAAMMFLMLLRG